MENLASPVQCPVQRHLDSLDIPVVARDLAGLRICSEDSDAGLTENATGLLRTGRAGDGERGAVAAGCLYFF